MCIVFSLLFFEWCNIFRDFSNVYALFVYLCAEKCPFLGTCLQQRCKIIH